MNRKILMILLFLSGMSSPAFAQTQTQIFDDMMKFFNQKTGLPAGHDNLVYELSMTNNTIRTNNTGKIFQYASYTQGYAIRHYAASTVNELRFSYLPQSFTKDEPSKELFQCTSRDKLDIRIYKEGTKVKVDIKLLSWGNGVTKHDATIAKTALGGYVLTFKSENRNFYTITLLGSTTDLPD